MKPAFLILILAFACAAQQSSDSQRACKERGRGIINNLGAQNMLRNYVESNGYGDCVRESWMDKMRALNIKQASFWIEFWWKKDKLAFKIKSVSYWTGYCDGIEVKDPAIVKSGLDADLRTFMLDKVKSEWKVERGKNSVSRDTFGAVVFDDESLPRFYSIS